MANKKKPRTSELPGLPLEEFRAAVEAVESLRDSGKLQLFLRPSGFFKVICDQAAFGNAYVANAPEGADHSLASKSLRDVARYCTACAATKNDDRLLNFLEGTVYDDEVENLDEPEKERFREQERAKFELIRSRLLTPAIRQRSNRMRTSTLPQLEEIDSELVTGRHDLTRDETIDEPFLRIRLRHSRPHSSEFPWMFMPGLLWGDGSYLSFESFEFECDESDIDFLLHRLTEAKKRLSETVNDVDEERCDE